MSPCFSCWKWEAGPLHRLCKLPLLGHIARPLLHFETFETGRHHTAQAVPEPILQLQADLTLLLLYLSS